jgi:hypothetical protein
LPIAYCLLPIAYCLLPIAYLPIAYLPVRQSLHPLFRRLCLQKLFGLQQPLHCAFWCPWSHLRAKVPQALHCAVWRPWSHFALLRGTFARKRWRAQWCSPPSGGKLELNFLFLFSSSGQLATCP